MGGIKGGAGPAGFIGGTGVARRLQALRVRPRPDVGVVDGRGQGIEDGVVGAEVEDVGSGVLLG